MTIAIGGIFHESNCFARNVTTYDDFRAVSLHTGEAIVARWAGTNSETAGFLRSAKNNEWTVAPTLMAWGMPSGPVADDALVAMTNELCDRIRAIPDLDGVLLVTHGAMVSRSHDDADGWWLGQVRTCVGENVPIVATADFHGNLTQEMIDAVDALIGYTTYPHTDFRERGEQAGDLLARLIRGEVHPTPALVQVPLIPNLLTQFTACGPMKTVMDEMRRVEREPGVVCASVFGGFQWADVAHAGMSVVVTTDGDAEAARTYAANIARVAWENRQRFKATALSPNEAVRRALADEKGPNVLVDTGDNVGGGAPGDGTVLLHELIKRGAHDALVLLWDPESVARAVETGVRNRSSFRLGGKNDPEHGTPVQIEGEVKLISDGRYTNVGPMRDGIVDDMGRTAVLACGGVTVVVTERRMPMWNLEQLRSLGVEPTRLHVIVVKAAVAHRAAYGPIANAMIDVDTPGITALDLRRFTFTRLRRPVYPLDEDATFGLVAGPATPA